MSEILERLEKMEGSLRAVLLTSSSSVEEMVDAIHRHTMLVAREGYMYRVQHFTRAPEHTFAATLARKAFPLPPKEVLREEPDPMGYAHAWRCWNGVLQFQTSPATGGNWMNATDGVYAVSPERVRLWADLMDNPYTEVPDEG